jgi:hypothetical protein
MMVHGTFEVQMNPEPAFEDVDGVALFRASFEKRLNGPLDATSQVQMLAAKTPVEGSAGYVAIERIIGALEGRAGSFVVVHQGLSRGAESALSVQIVPDSGTGELRGIAGTMNIEIVDGVHRYELDYTLEA